MDLNVSLDRAQKDLKKFLLSSIDLKCLIVVTPDLFDILLLHVIKRVKTFLNSPKILKAIFGTQAGLVKI